MTRGGLPSRSAQSFAKRIGEPSFQGPSAMSDVYAPLAESDMWILGARLDGSEVTVVVGSSLKNRPDYEIHFGGVLCLFSYNEMDFYREDWVRDIRCIVRSKATGNGLYEIVGGAIIDCALQGRFGGDGVRGLLVATGSECLEIFAMDMPTVRSVG